MSKQQYMTPEELQTITLGVVQWTWDLEQMLLTRQ